ncbi:MAG: beta-galactosidase, partial [Solirubrobacteraceae bacterium]|nr:beta-galactosidase [Solirubrobacteraceae bacterium]
MPRLRNPSRPVVGLVFVVLAAAAVIVVHQRRDHGESFAVAVQSNGPAGAVTLDRGWRYRADPHDVGIRRRWQALRPAGRQVTLPWVPNAEPVNGPAGTRNYAGSVGWYSTRFAVRRAGLYSIHFESVSHYAIVWLDGRRVGS